MLVVPAEDGDWDKELVMRPKVTLVLLLIAAACGTRTAEVVGPPTPSPPDEPPIATVAPAGDTTPTPDHGKVGGSGRKQPRAEPTEMLLGDGRHATYLTGIDVGDRTLTVDVIQFLTGQQAVDAYHRDYPADPDGPPNDYYIVNDNPRLRTLPVAADVKVRLVRLHEGRGAELKPGNWEELPAYLAHYPDEGRRLSGNPFWITVAAGRVTAIDEQYIP